MDEPIPTEIPLPDSMTGEGIRRYDFYQAVKLLEGMTPGKPGVGENPDPKKEALCFKTRVSLDFPAGDTDRLEPGEPHRFWINFLGLAGHFGPLPDAFTEWVMHETFGKNQAMRDFLDIFNHRLVSLMVRNRRKHRLGLEAKHPENTAFAHWLMSLLGMGSEKTRNRQAVPDRVFLDFTGLFLRHSRSLPGLEILLRDYFRVPVKGEQFLGRWDKLDADVRTTIGRTGLNRKLGRGALLGKRVWDQQSTYGLHIGPVEQECFFKFLPGGGYFEELQSLTRFYTGPSLNGRVTLSLQTNSLPGARLSAVKGSGARLGWTSWLKADKVSGTPAVQLKL